MSSDYRSALIAGATAAGIEVSPALADAMTAHYAHVVKWAARINLTSVTDPVQAASIHGVDSLLFLRHLTAGRAVDVGSGAGFPGLVLALARPDVKMTLLEPKRKRASFLRVALAELGRADVAVIEARYEEARALFPVEQILSRATIPPISLIERSGDKLTAGGRLVITGGAGAPSIAEVEEAARRAGLVHFARTHHVLPTGETRILDVIARADADPS